MFTRLSTAALCLLSMLMLPGLATAEDDNVCQNRKWTGSYLDGAFADGYVLRWNFGRDGTLHADFTGSPQDAYFSGQLTPILGSWECRGDGKIVATYIYAQYGAIEQLVRHVRVTALITILDNNHLERTAFVARSYAPGDDVMDPTGGVPTVVSDANGWYLTRLSAAQEDLQALP